MSFSYALHIIIGYGRYIIFIALSLLLSSYLLYYIDFGYEYFAKILYKPEIAAKYLIRYLTAFYNNYHLMNFKITRKILFILITPYVTYKIIFFIIKFFTFFLATKLENKMPILAQFIHKLNSMPVIFSNSSSKNSKNKIINNKLNKQSAINLPKFDISQKSPEQPIKKNFRR